jgi:hypothetical protein
MKRLLARHKVNQSAFIPGVLRYKVSGMKKLLLLVALTVSGTLQAQTAELPANGWLDRMHRGTHGLMWRSAMRLDRLFGSKYDQEAYSAITGSITPALLWDEYRGFEPKLRFRISAPLPGMDERFNAFLGRVDPDEYVSEEAPASGAISRQFGPSTQDETILGIGYFTPRKPGARFDAGAGLRLSTPLDPYLKGSFIYERGALDRLLFSFRETAFWRNSERLGLTTRIDLQRYFMPSWLLRWTSSGTVSQESQGLKGYSSLMALRALSERSALAFAMGFDGETDAVIPLHDYGFKAAYRRRIAREWLALELRGSVSWPRERLEETRGTNWGMGIGFEIFFGTEEFLARPATF